MAYRFNSVFLEKFQPIIAELLSSSLTDNEQVKIEAMVKYNEDIQSLVFELSEEHLKIKTEQNSIRLIASTEVDGLLDNLEISVKTATDLTIEMLRVMASPEFFEDQNLILPYQDKLAVFGSKAQEAHHELREQMKVELNEI